MIGFVKNNKHKLSFQNCTFSFHIFFSLFSSISSISLFFTPFHPAPSLSLMINIPMIVGVIVLMMVIVVSADDTQALRHTVSSLCSLNNAGKFASCCSSYDINSLSLANSPARSCFIFELRSRTGSVLTSLFVY